MQFDDLTLPHRETRGRARRLPLRRRPSETPDAFAIPAPRQPSFPGWLRGLLAGLTALIRAVRRERDLRRGIEQLYRLDDRSLRDIGIEDRSRIETLVRGGRR